MIDYEKIVSTLKFLHKEFIDEGYCLVCSTKTVKVSYPCETIQSIQYMEWEQVQ